MREGTIRFIDSTGKQLVATIFAEGVINTVQKMLEISANSQILNFGAPAVTGAAAAVLEGQRTMIAAERQRLQTAQEIRDSSRQRQGRSHQRHGRHQER